LLKNENIGSEMVEILSHLLQYVPSKECANLVYIPGRNQMVLKPGAVVHHVLFGGDQLTAARARGAIMAMANNPTPQQRLEGVIPVIEDWQLFCWR
jgi:L1 cell adhesion molecule like protein